MTSTPSTSRPGTRTGHGCWTRNHPATRAPGSATIRPAPPWLPRSPTTSRQTPGPGPTVGQAPGTWARHRWALRSTTRCARSTGPRTPSGAAGRRPARARPTPSTPALPTTSCPGSPNRRRTAVPGGTCSPSTAPDPTFRRRSPPCPGRTPGSSSPGFTRTARRSTPPSSSAVQPPEPLRPAVRAAGRNGSGGCTADEDGGVLLRAVRVNPGEELPGVRPGHGGERLLKVGSGAVDGEQVPPGTAVRRRFGEPGQEVVGSAGVEGVGRALAGRRPAAPDRVRGPVDLAQRVVERSAQRCRAQVPGAWPTVGPGPGVCREVVGDLGNQGGEGRMVAEPGARVAGWLRVQQPWPVRVPGREVDGVDIVAVQHEAIDLDTPGRVDPVRRRQVPRGDECGDVAQGVVRQAAGRDLQPAVAHAADLGGGPLPQVEQRVLPAAQRQELGCVRAGPGHVVDARPAVVGGERQWCACDEADPVPRPGVEHGIGLVARTPLALPADD